MKQDKQFLDAIHKLTTAEILFITDLMQLVDADPLKSEARATAAEQMASRYQLRTAEGRASFLEALRAV